MDKEHTKTVFDVTPFPEAAIPVVKAHQAALDEITLYDIYKAVDCVDDEGLFHLHENPNVECPVGRNIHKAMDGRIEAAQAALENELKSTTLAQVVADTRKIIDEE